VTAASIQAAVNNCAGGTITLPAGTFNLTNHVAVNQPVTITGAGQTSTFLVQTAAINIFQVTANNVTIENMDINTATHNPGVPPIQKSPVPGTIFSSGLNTHVTNLSSEAGTGFGMRFTKGPTCSTFPDSGTVITNVTSTNTGTGGFTALDIDCTNGASLSNVTIHGDYIALYEDEHVTINGEDYTAGPYESGKCGNDWYVSGPASNILVENVVTHNGKGKSVSGKGPVTNLTITNETYAAGDTCTNGL
jgi:hypothetical protein